MRGLGGPKALGVVLREETGGQGGRGGCAVLASHSKARSGALSPKAWRGVRHGGPETHTHVLVRSQTPASTEMGHARPVTPADMQRRARALAPGSALSVRGRPRPPAPRRLPRARHAAVPAAGGELASARGRVCLRVCTHVCGLPAPSAADSLVYSSSTLGPRQPPCRPPKPACLFQPLRPPGRRCGEAPLPAPGWGVCARGGGGPWAPAHHGGLAGRAAPCRDVVGPPNPRPLSRLFPSVWFTPTGRWDRESRCGAAPGLGA